MSYNYIEIFFHDINMPRLTNNFTYEYWPLEKYKLLQLFMINKLIDKRINVLLTLMKSSFEHCDSG